LLPHLFLKLIRENKKFKTSYELFAPPIYAYVQSFATNPNCSCRNKIKAHVNSNLLAHNSFIEHFFQKNKEEFGGASLEKLKAGIIEEKRNSAAATGITGKFARIKKSQWAEFPAKMATERKFIGLFPLFQ
jgi:hypothetical protein